MNLKVAARHGFTLIELVITLAVAAILLAYAVPSFINAIQTARAQTLANRFASDLAWVRGQAIAGHSATLILNPDCTWNAVIDGAQDGAHSYRGEPDLANTTCTGMGPGVSFSFNSLGLIASAPPGVLTFAPVSGAGIPTQLQVLGSGSVIISPESAS